MGQLTLLQKRGVSVILSIIVGAAVALASVLWQPTTALAFSGGSGTEEDPYQVATIDDLNSVRDDLDAYYVQVADIDLSGIEWEPIGTFVYGDSCYAFSGSYDGDGYSISNMTITNTEYIDGLEVPYLGLFGYALNAAHYANINIVDMTIDVNLSAWSSEKIYTYRPSVGGIVGDTGGGEIENCAVTGTVSLSEVGAAYVGGVAGKAGSITSSVNNATLQVSGVDESEYESNYSTDSSVGGIAGYASRVQDCKNYGEVTASCDDFLYCGGIVGNHASVYDCINYADIYGWVLTPGYGSSYADQANVGGIIGVTSGTVNSCINYGFVTAGVDDTENEWGIHAGGIIGFSSSASCSVTNCYNVAASITSEGVSSTAGRIAGVIQQASANYSIDTTLVNGSIPNAEDTGESTIHGGSLTAEEIAAALDVENDSEGFTLGRDNNSFTHSLDGDFSGCRYQLTLEGFNTLKKYATRSEVNEIKQDLWTEATGFCYGLSTAMALVYNDYLSVSDLTSSVTDDSTFFDLPKPNSDSELLKSLTYYHFTLKTSLLDWFAGGGVAIATAENQQLWFDSGEGTFDQDEWTTFLKTLVEVVNIDEPYVLSYNLFTTEAEFDNDSGSAHSVLLTDCSFDEDSNKWLVTVYDVNTVSNSNPKGVTGVMAIDADFSGFTYTRGDGPVYDMLNFYCVSLTDPRLLVARGALLGKSDSVSESNGSDASNDNNCVYLHINRESNIIVLNEDGKQFTYLNNKFSGDIPIESILADVNGDSAQIQIKIPYSSSYTIESDTGSIDIIIYDGNNYYSLTGSGISSARFEIGVGVTFDCSDDSEFNLFISTIDEIADGETGLVSLEGSGSGQIQITQQSTSVLVETEGDFQFSEAVSYVDITSHEVEIEDGATSFELPALEETGGSEPGVTDPDDEDVSNPEDGESGSVEEEPGDSDSDVTTPDDEAEPGDADSEATIPDEDEDTPATYPDAETYTVIYTDGINGEAFADQVYDDLERGETTPSFDGVPTRDGYEFLGWSPEVTETVTADVTYVAQWNVLSDESGETPSVDDGDDDGNITSDDSTDSDISGEDSGETSEESVAPNQGNGSSTKNPDTSDGGAQQNPAGDSSDDEVPAAGDITVGAGALLVGAVFAVLAGMVLRSRIRRSL